MSRVAKMFAGARLRRLREEHGLTQVALARALGLSTSYVNQLENDQRPITVPVLLTLTERFDLPTQYFAPDSDARLVSDLQGGPRRRDTRPAAPDRRTRRPNARGRSDAGQPAPPTTRRHRGSRSAATAAPNVETSSAPQQPMPFEEVRDFFYDRKNYIGELDVAAEELFNRNHLRVGGLDGQLAAAP